MDCCFVVLFDVYLRSLLSCCMCFITFNLTIMETCHQKASPYKCMCGDLYHTCIFVPLRTHNSSLEGATELKFVLARLVLLLSVGKKVVNRKCVISCFFVFACIIVGLLFCLITCLFVPVCTCVCVFVCVHYVCVTCEFVYCLLACLNQ